MLIYMYHQFQFLPPVLSQYTVLPRCYAPPFCDRLPGKRGGGGGGVTKRTCTFTSQLTPPPPPMNSRTEINEALLCSRRRELHRHAVAVLKDGRVVGHVHVAIFCSSLAARLLPPAARLHGRMTCRITGLRKPFEISEKSQDLATRIQLIYTCNTCTRARARTAVPQTGSSGPRGGCVMEVN